MGLESYVWLESSESTNADLRKLIMAASGRDEWIPTGFAVATLEQTQGKGRLGRTWSATAGDSLALSLLARVDDRVGMPIGWVPLLVGTAVSRVVREVLETEAASIDTTGVQLPKVGVKWPNDVLVVRDDGTQRKICGILCEILHPDPKRIGGTEVIVGIGVNVSAPEERLPAENATSLRFELDQIRAGGIERSVRGDGGVRLQWAFEQNPDFVSGFVARTRDEVLGIIAEVLRYPERIDDLVGAESLTIGKSVRAYLPGGQVLDGVAHRFADDGALVIATADGQLTMLRAGDVVHLRPGATQ